VLGLIVEILILSLDTGKQTNKQKKDPGTGILNISLKDCILSMTVTLE